MAAKESLINLGVLKDKVAMNAAGAAGDIAEGTAKTAKIGFPQNIPMLIGFAAQVVGIVSAIKNATKATEKITPTTGYKTGGYTGVGSADDVAGIQHKDEYVVPQFITQDPTYAPLINQLEQKRTESLGVENSLPNNVASAGTSTNDTMLTTAVQLLIAKLDEPIMAAALIGDNQINDLTKRTDKLKQVRNNAKIG